MMLKCNKLFALRNLLLHPFFSSALALNFAALRPGIMSNNRNNIFFSAESCVSLGRRRILHRGRVFRAESHSSLPRGHDNDQKLNKSGRTIELEKLMQGQGFGSKKQCRSIIQDGLVTVSGLNVTDPGHKVAAEDGMVFTVNGVQWIYWEKAYIVLHKPCGFECSNRPTNHPSVFELLPPQLQEITS